MDKPYKLASGIHNGTFTSRDCCDAKDFDTRDEAIAWLEDRERCYADIGYVMWFATLTHLDGTREQLRNNGNYRN